MCIQCVPAIVCLRLCCAHNRIVNIMEVYIERSNMQVELIQLHKNIDFIHVTFAKLGTSDPLYVYSLFARWQ